MEKTANELIDGLRDGSIKYVRVKYKKICYVMCESMDNKGIAVYSPQYRRHINNVEALMLLSVAIECNIPITIE